MATPFYHSKLESTHKAMTSADSFYRYLRKHVQIRTFCVQANPELHQRTPSKQTTASCSPSAVLFSPTIKDNGPSLGCHKKKHQQTTRSSQASGSHLPPALGSPVRFAHSRCIHCYLCHNTFMSIAPIVQRGLVMCGQCLTIASRHHRPWRLSGFQQDF